eukprot:3706225-Lingulodinium_polyedra.AAC.1
MVHVPSGSESRVSLSFAFPSRVSNRGSPARFGCVSSVFRMASRAKTAFQHLRFSRAFRAENRTANMRNH